MSDERKRLVMIVLLLALGLVVGWRYVLPALSGGDGDFQGRVGGPVASRAADAQVSTLDLDSLTAEVRNYKPGRNLFQYYRVPPPPKPPPPKVEGPSPEELARRAEEARLAREAARLAREEELRRNPPKPQPPAFQLTYLGSFGPENRRIAVFTDGEEIYNALVGDVLDDSFVVSDIGFESVSITFVGFPDTPATRVGLGG